MSTTPPTFGWRPCSGQGPHHHVERRAVRHPHPLFVRARDEPSTVGMFSGGNAKIRHHRDLRRLVARTHCDVGPR